MITTVAVVPSTPLLLPDAPGRRHPRMAELGAAAGRVTAGLADVDVAVVLAGGPCAAVHDAPATDLAGYGLHLAPVALRRTPAEVPDALRTAFVEAGDEPAGTAPDLATLSRWVPAGTPAAGVVVPVRGTAGAEAQSRLAGAIVELAVDRRLGLLVAGDLGAGHGEKPPRPEAAAASAQLQDAVVAALDNGRPADLVRLDPDLVAASGSRAAGALRVLGRVLEAARLGTVVRGAGAPLGVGYVVAQGG